MPEKQERETVKIPWLAYPLDEIKLMEFQFLFNILQIGGIFTAMFLCLKVK